MAKDSLGNRMKDNYENRNRHHLLKRVPVVVRVDGRAFHTFTKGFGKPFCNWLRAAMTYAAKQIVLNETGCVAAYTQSDEASFLFLDYKDLQTQPWFDYDQSKIETICASAFTAYFNDHLTAYSGKKPAMFDARAFNVPREEVTNYFLWRMKDWERNSLQMFARSKFSAKDLHGKSHSDVHEMLHSVGANWTRDVEPLFRNGTWIIGDQLHFDVQPNYASLNTLLEGFIHCDRGTEDTPS